MAAIKFGDICPAYDWISCDKFHCDNCSHLDGYFLDDENNEIVGCKYSKIPYFDSPFNVGDMVWYLDEGRFPTNEKVRKIVWCGTCYKYLCGRKQTSYTVYRTKEECHNALAIKECKDGIIKIKDAIQLAGGVENLKQLINIDSVKLLNDIKQLI